MKVEIKEIMFSFIPSVKIVLIPPVKLEKKFTIFIKIFFKRLSDNFFSNIISICC